MLERMPVACRLTKKNWTVAKVANGETEQFDEYNNENAQWIDTKNAANDERREQRSTGGAGSRSRENSRTRLV